MSAIDHDLSPQLGAQRAAIETLYRAFSEHNPDLVDSVLAPDWEDIPMAPGQVAGPEGIKALIRMLGQAFPDLKITVQDIVQEAGKLCSRAEISGTLQGTLFGIPGTGQKVRILLQEFHAFQDGLVTKTWHIEDWFGMFQQLRQFPPQA